MRISSKAMLKNNLALTNYLVIALGIYILIAAGLLLVVPIQDYNILVCQLILIICSVLFISVGWRIPYRSIFLLILGFQLIFSYLLFWDFKYIVGHILGYNAIDSSLYSEIAQKTYDLSFKQAINVFEDYLRSVSDYGFPIFLRLIYRLADGNVEFGHKILILTNCFLQIATCYITGKISSSIGISYKHTKLIVLLWGINPCSIYLNVSGLKEPLFTFICMSIMYGMYKCHASRSILKHITLLILIALSWFFRNYMTIFFILIYWGFCVFQNAYKKIFLSICILSLTLCIGFTSLLVEVFPEIYYAMLQSEEILPSGIAKYVYYALAFLAPIPKFFNISTPQMLLVVGYSILKFSCSIFAIVGCWYWIKNKTVTFFPLINIFLFTVIMLIVSAHYIDYRYAYPIMPCFFIMMVEGVRYCKKGVSYLYLLCSTLIVVAFNMQLY